MNAYQRQCDAIRADLRAARAGHFVQDFAPVQNVVPVQHCARCTGTVYVVVLPDDRIAGDAFGPFLYRSADDAAMGVVVLDDGAGAGRSAS